MSKHNYKTAGQQVILDVWFERWNDAFLDGLVRILCGGCKLNILQDMRRYFEGQGITYVAILAESHLVIHTYPEHAYLSIDLYTCGTTAQPQRAKAALLGSSFNIKKIKQRSFRRG